MFAKSLLAAGALLAATGSMSYGKYIDKSYEVNFPTSVQAGSLELSPGTYRVSRHGNEAIFKNVKTHKKYRTPATVEHIAYKNPTEQVQMVNINGRPEIQMITLGGHKVDLQFNVS